jgi:uncharacterized protein (TIGR02271 family)
VEPEPLTIRDASGRRVDADLVDRHTDGSLQLRGPEGQRWWVPADAIVRREGSEVHLAVDLTGLADPATRTDEPLEREVIPLVEERLSVDTKFRPTATVRVRTRTLEREETIEEALSHESVDVHRVPIDRLVDEPAAVRVEGDTTIVPVHEEVLFVEKRLLLKEEVHLTKRTTDRTETQRVTIRSQTADIERSEPEE